MARNRMFNEAADMQRSPIYNTAQLEKVETGVLECERGKGVENLIILGYEEYRRGQGCAGAICLGILLQLAIIGRLLLCQTFSTLTGMSQERNGSKLFPKIWIAYLIWVKIGSIGLICRALRFV